MPFKLSKIDIGIFLSKINVGKYIGIFPSEVNQYLEGNVSHIKVKSSVDYIKKPCWRDWFVI